MLLTFFILFAALLFQPTPTTQPAQENSKSMRVMTFNLRYASKKTPNSWPERRPVTKALLKKQAPDLIGTQEGLEPQLKDIDADLGPAYTRFGRGREKDGGGEHSAFYYRADRFELLSHGDFWFADTPDVPGIIAWGAQLPRLATWGELRDKATGKTFFAFNCHFDHASEEAREKSAELLRDRINKIAGNSAVILTGDFNECAMESKPYSILTGDKALTDTWPLAAEKGNDVNSFHGYDPIQHDGKRIDWVLFRGNAKVARTAVDTFSIGGQYPSDHFPVVTDITIE